VTPQSAKAVINTRPFRICGPESQNLIFLSLMKPCTHALFEPWPYPLHPAERYFADTVPPFAPAHIASIAHSSVTVISDTNVAVRTVTWLGQIDFPRAGLIGLNVRYTLRNSCSRPDRDTFHFTPTSCSWITRARFAIRNECRVDELQRQQPILCVSAVLLLSMIAMPNPTPWHYDCR
jgi:hypothetical protein